MPSSIVAFSASQKRNKTTKQVLRSLSRTLSPGKSKSSTSHRPLSTLPPTPPLSPGPDPALNPPARISSDDDEGFVDVSLTESEKLRIDQAEVVKGNEEVQIGVYLTEISSRPTRAPLPLNDVSSSSTHVAPLGKYLKDTQQWQEFFKIGKEDFERERKLPSRGQPAHHSIASSLHHRVSPNSADPTRVTIISGEVATVALTPSSPAAPQLTAMKRVKSDQVVYNSPHPNSLTVDDIPGTHETTPPTLSPTAIHNLVVSANEVDALAITHQAASLTPPNKTDPYQARRMAEEALGLSSADADVIDQLTFTFSPTLHTFSPATDSSSANADIAISEDTGTALPNLPSPSSASSITDRSQTPTRPSVTRCSTTEPAVGTEPSATPVDHILPITPMSEHAHTTSSIISTELIKSPVRPIRPKTSVKDFEIIRVLGKGCAGKVLMVKYRPLNLHSTHTERVYAMKSIRKNHVLAHRELQHTLTEQSVLRRVADEPGSNPFIVRLWWSFHVSSSSLLSSSSLS